MLGIGTYKLSCAETVKIVTRGLELGYRMIDTAELYENEHAVQQAIQCSSISRDEIFVTTKVRVASVANFERALSIFNGRLDCLLLHFPSSAFLEDWRLLVEWKSQQPTASIRHIGVSNFTLKHLEAIRDAKVPLPYCNQIEVSPFWSRPDLRQFHRRHNILTVAHSPLTKMRMANDPTLVAWCKMHAITPCHFLLDWSTANCDMTLVGTRNIQHLEYNFSHQKNSHFIEWDQQFATHPQHKETL
jgi:diketogulonate reductase-like aldo/keto reductase